MGCFVSTNSAAPPQSKPHRISTSNGGSKSPPPVDEETVKQVLSEPPVSTSFHGNERMLHHNGGDARKSAASLSHSTFSESFSAGNDGTLRWRPMLSGRSIPGELKREKTAGRSPGRVKLGSGYSCKPGKIDSSRSGPGSSNKGNYPSRIRCGSGERIPTGEKEEREPPTNNDLLESSLVSLECFIFL